MSSNTNGGLEVDAALHAQIVHDYIIDNPDLFQEEPKKRRKTERITDYENTSWGRMLADPATRDPTTYLGKLFRRRYRLPFQVFDEILLPMCITHSIFGSGKNATIPVAIKLMVALRILGRGVCCDDPTTNYKSRLCTAVRSE
jgi:hypothetical protein